MHIRIGTIEGRKGVQIFQVVQFLDLGTGAVQFFEFAQ
jgi:hypothetical protein